MTTTPIIVNHVAGPFSATWAPLGASPVTIGIIGEGGFNELRRYEGGEETTADLLGGGAVDATHIGSNMFLEFNLEEANLLGVMQITHPFTLTDTLAHALLHEGEYGVPGKFFTDAYGALVLTPAFAALNSAGAQATPIRTYGVCTLAPGFDLKKKLSSNRRVFPIRLRVWPYFDSGSSAYVFYTKTALS